MKIKLLRKALLSGIGALLATLGMAQGLFSSYNGSLPNGGGKQAIRVDLNQFENRFAVKQTAKRKHWLLVNDIQLLQRGGITFTLPGTSRELRFRATQVHMDKPDTFRWAGKLLNGTGTISLFCDEGRVHGYMQIGADSYQFYGAQEGLTLLVENDLVTNIKGDCAVQGGSSGLPEKPRSSGRMVACYDNLRVLFLFTQRVQNAGLNVNDVVNQAVNQFNTAVNNSSASIGPMTQVAVVGILPAPTSFTEDVGGNVINDANAIRLNADIQNLRNQNNADVVCVLTNAGYSNAPGSVPNQPSDQIPATNAGAYMIAEVTTAALVGRFTFAHELGHLLGGRDDDDDGAPGYSRGFAFSAVVNNGQPAQNFTTIMHRFRGAAEPRVLHYATCLVPK